MAKKKEHIIERQTINLEIEGNVSDSEVKDIQRNVIHAFKNRIGNEIKRIFDRVAPPDVELVIEHLTINLDAISFRDTRELEQKLYKQISEQVLRAVKEKLEKIERQRRKGRGGKKRISKVDIFEHFMYYGHMPTWASIENGTMKDIFADIVRNDTNAVLNIIIKIKDSKAMRERLFQQFKAGDLELLVQKIFANNKKVFQQLLLIKKRLGKKSEKAIMSAAINYALDKGSINEIKERSFARAIVEDVQKRKIDINPASKVRAGYTDEYNDLQILSYFLEYGAIPYWGDVGTKQSFRELFDNLMQTRLASVQRLIEKNANKPYFLQRLIFQFDTEDILKLLEPTPGENIRYIKDTIKDFAFLTNERAAIAKTASFNKIRATVLTVALEYFFVQGKNRFIKQTFVQNVLQSLAESVSTPYEVLVKESYKTVRRKKKNTAIKEVLETLDGNLQNQLDKERKTLRQTQRDILKTKKELERILDRLKNQNLSESALQKLQKQQKSLEKDLGKLERKAAELGEDMPLEIEQIWQQRQLIQQQIRRASIEEKRQKLQERLDFTQKEFDKVKNNLSKDLDRLFKERSKLKDQSSSLQKKKLQRVENKLRKYQDSLQEIIGAMQTEEKNLELFLTDIRNAMRQAKTAEERRQLRQERSRAEKELIALREALKELETEHAKLLDEIDQVATVVTDDAEAIPASSQTSKLDFLIFFLKYGSTPWWAEDFAKQTIEEIFLEFANQAPRKLRRAFSAVGKYPVVWERIINQLSEAAIREIITKTFGNDAKVIFGQVQILYTMHYAQSFDKLSSIPEQRFKWAVILEYLFTNNVPFSEQKFSKEIIIQTARSYGITAAKLVEYTTNIANNNMDSFLAPFQTWSKMLIEDEDIARTDRELIAAARQSQKRQEGTLLTSNQKMALLIEFLQTGMISDLAKDYKYTTVDAFEQLFYEQIQKDKTATKEVVLGLLKLSNTREIFLYRFSEDAFWELAQLVNPKSVLPMTRLFKDLKKALKDKQLHTEKEVLLHLHLQQSPKFDPLIYLESLILVLQQQTGRKAISILEDWKRKVLKIDKPDSSLYLSVLALEVNILKAEQESISDPEQRKPILQQLEALTLEYNTKSRELVDLLLTEVAESEGIAEKKYKLSEIKQLVARLEEDLKGFEAKLLTADALKTINYKREIARIKSQIKQLLRQKPPALRIVEKQLKAQEVELEEVDKLVKVEQLKVPEPEPLVLELEIETSLIERQIDLLDLLKKEAPTVLRLLPALLKELDDTDRTHQLFVEQLRTLAAELPDKAYAAKVLNLITEPPSEILVVSNDATLSKKQKDLWDKVLTASPFELWQDWDDLQQYYDNNPTIQTAEQEQTILQIYRKVKRRHQQNLLSLANNLQQLRKRLSLKIEEATTVDQLLNLKEEIQTTELQQIYQLDEIISVARDATIQRHFEALKANLSQLFNKIKNERIRKLNIMSQQHVDDLKRRKNAAALTIEELKQQRDFLLDEIRKDEEPEEKAIVPKPKKQQKVEKTAVPPPIDEPLQVYNVGLVLLWPFFSRLFKMMKLVENKAFIDEEAQYKAIHILQYLATGKTESPENELVLNKVFCGLEITAPVPLSVEFTPEELKLADSLLQGALKNWERMKNMSPAGFRSTFLIREGTIKEEEDRWQITVRKQSFDVLMKTLPWGYNFIKLPWLSKFISVDWPTM